MKKAYEKAELELLYLDMADIIVTSDGDEDFSGDSGTGGDTTN